jgi:nicotinic acid phosphoribosyltransferase
MSNVQSKERKLRRQLAAKRAAMRRSFFDKMFLLGGWIGGTDTYKRTMWAAVDDIAVLDAAYHLTLRKGLSEPGAGSQLIMAGHEVMMAQWFRRPLKRRDIELAAHFYAKESNVKVFPTKMWNEVLASQKGENIYLPVDVWGFPGGQSFLKGVPCLSFNGMGGVVSYLEPAKCRYFAPIIHATKARLMKMATDRDAEFGLRAAVNELANIELLLARYVGSGGTAQLTSNDTAEFMWPELFKSIGTVGHEMMCSNQSFDTPLSDSEYEMMNRFVEKLGFASLLCDLVDAESVGLNNALRVIKGHPETKRVGIRVDSGNIAKQCVLYFKKMVELGIEPRTIVFEDEVEPEKVKEVYRVFKEETGREPEMLFPGAGGYWWKLVHRDEVSAAFKRSATAGHPNVKFSNSPGKESLGGNLRVYGRGDTMIVADASETIDGEPLFVKLVENGRYIYNESFQAQAARANATWGKYTKVELSPLVKSWMEQFQSMRATEVSLARQQLGANSEVK